MKTSQQKDSVCQLNRQVEQEAPNWVGFPFGSHPPLNHPKCYAPGHSQLLAYLDI